LRKKKEENRETCPVCNPKRAYFRYQKENSFPFGFFKVTTDTIFGTAMVVWLRL
jgi:hypothetical protein